MSSENNEGHKLPTMKLLPAGETRMARLYAAGALAVLLITTTVWAVLGARLHQDNADQLANTYLFEHWSTFQNATFPSAHSFLLKWPLFLLIRLVGPSSTSFMVATVIITLITVASLAYILYRINKRPFIFGSLMLALASMLLLVPPEPSAGGLLPVNMAMLATRNLEYVLYIGSLVFMIRAKKITDRGFWLGVGGLALLIASDKLFLFLSFGAALLALVKYSFVRRGELTRLALRWLVMAGLATVLAMTTLWLINTSGLTHLSSQTNSGPFGLAHSFRSFALGTIFAGLGLLTNFGANPAYDTGVLAHVFSVTRSRMMSLEGIGITINLVLLGSGLYLATRFLLNSLKRSRLNGFKTDTATKLSLLLLWSTLAAIVAFIVTDHYYAADARYLGISLFAVMITVATYLRNNNSLLTRKATLGVSAILTLSVVVGLIVTLGTYRTDKAALAAIHDRNVLVLAAVTNHPVSLLVGDYWRVLPIKQMAARPQRVMPLSSCTQPRQALSSKAWRPDLDKNSFAYLLSLDRGLTDYPTCNLAQVLQAYGRPNASLVISGTSANPRELLLFYDGGTNLQPTTATTPPRPLTTIVPISLAQLPHLTCSSGQTIMNIVAHQDDDLLFMNPYISSRITAGDCLRTIYMTAGDAGLGKLYWLSREQGSQAAYDYMDGPVKDIWAQRTVTLSSRSFITVVNPKANSRISLIFFHLPDGNINGKGFTATNNESLAKLEAGQESRIASVDGQSNYTSAELVNAIGALMKAYNPSVINTQATSSPSKQYTDHSDHMVVGRYAAQAYKAMNLTIPINYYYGYPVRDMLPNVTDKDLANKTAAFLAYIKLANDTGCSTSEDCLQLSTYGSYLRRQYSYTLPH